MMFIRFYFWLILVLAIGLLPFEKVAAQKLRQSAVYLSNGSVVKGRIIQNDSIKGLRVSNDCGIWFYKPDEIDSIGMLHSASYFTAKDKGYYNITSFSLLLGKGAYDNTPIPSAITINGYKFLPLLATGIGVGYEYYNWGVMPLFADARLFIYDQGLSPFIFAQAGYAISFTNTSYQDWYTTIVETFGGPMLSTGGGFRVGISGNTAFSLSVAYRYQKLSHDTSSYWEPETVNRVFTNYNRIALTVGFLFE